MAETATEKKAKNAILIAAAEESVNMVSMSSLSLVVKGTADDAADMSRYATICHSRKKNKKKFNLIITSFTCKDWILHKLFRCVFSFLVSNSQSSYQISSLILNSQIEKSKNLINKIYLF